jgi:hypothetical protein
MNKIPNHITPTSNCIPGFWEVPKTELKLKSHNVVKTEIMTHVKSLEGILDDDSCDAIISLFNSSKIESAVSVSGLMNDSYGVGSIRTTGWSLDIANELTKLIIPHLEIKMCDDLTPTDWWQNDGGKLWKPHSVSPLLRFMRYNKDSEHYAHYDTGYIYDSNFRTLKSMVIYLTNNKIGATRFIEDYQQNIPIQFRHHHDWHSRVDKSEIIASCYPEKGKVLLFDHRLCHDVEKYDGMESSGRIIIRGDIIYERLEN